VAALGAMLRAAIGASGRDFIAGAGLTEARATAMLLDACNHNGLITEDGQKSVMASIRSGIRNGKTRLRTVPESNGQDHESREDDVPADDPYQDQGSERRYQFVPGGSFILDTDATPVPLWGQDDQVWWSDGEGLIIAGAQGLGKTTLAQQVVLGRCGSADMPRCWIFRSFPASVGCSIRR
jgi:hypothetical protein